MHAAAPCSLDTDIHVVGTDFLFHVRLACDATLLYGAHACRGSVYLSRRPTGGIEFEYLKVEAIKCGPSSTCDSKPPEPKYIGDSGHGHGYEPVGEGFWCYKGPFGQELGQQECDAGLFCDYEFWDEDYGGTGYCRSCSGCRGCACNLGVPFSTESCSNSCGVEITGPGDGLFALRGQVRCDELQKLPISLQIQPCCCQKHVSSCSES